MKAVLVALNFLIFVGLASSPATAQNYPTRSIRMIVQQAAGGTHDLGARVIADLFQKRTGQTMVVENRSGGDSVIAMQAAMSADPDGYTLILGDMPGFTLIPQTKTVNYDPQRDFVPIARLASSGPAMISAGINTPYKDVKELVAYAKANPGKISYGSGGLILQLPFELLRIAAGIDMKHVPYRGATARAVTDVLGGVIDMTSSSPATTIQYVRDGKMRALGVTTKERVASAPEVPTFVEQGYPSVVMGQWYGLFGPKDIPDSVVDYLARELAEVVKAPEWRAFTAQYDFSADFLGPAEFKKVLAEEIRSAGTTIERAGLREQ